MKLAFGSPCGNYFTPGLYAAYIRRPGLECQIYTDTALIGYQFTPWSSGASEIREFHVMGSVGFEQGTSRYAVERATTEPTRPTLYDKPPISGFLSVLLHSDTKIT